MAFFLGVFSGWPLLGRLIFTALAGLGLATSAMAFDLQGHRGARGLLPENSLEGFQKAIELGVSTLELDVGMSRDGVLVIYHDRDISPLFTRDAQGQWMDKSPGTLFSMAWEDIRRYDIGRIKPGTTYARNFASQVPRDGTRIPRLADLFEMVKKGGHGHIRFAIETKLSPVAPSETPDPETFTAALWEEIKKAGMQQRVQILSFDWRTLQIMQRLAPQVDTVYLSAQQSWLDNIGAQASQPSPWTAGWAFANHGSVPRMIKAAGGRIWSAFHGDLTEALVREAQSLGLRVLVWTVNNPEQMARFVDMGVDGLVTDRPDLAADLLRKRGVRVR